MKKNNTPKTPVAVFVTDTHLTKDNGALVKDIFKQIIELCKVRGIKRIFHGGDVFTSRSGQPLSCLTDWSEILNYIQSAGLEIFAIPGNHDKTDPDDERSYLDVYEDRMTIFRNGSIKLLSQGVAVAFIPYFRDERWIEEYRKVDELLNNMYVDQDINTSWNTILITHSGFDGVMNNDGSKVESIIKPSMFAENWDKVLIGHYHNASKLTDNVIYPGAAYQNNFGETITDKGCTIIYSDASLEFVPLKFPRYIKEVIDVDDKEGLKNLIEKYEGEDYDHIRFIFRGKKADANKVNISELANLGIEAKYEALETEDMINVADSEEVLSYDKKSLTRDFMKFCSEQKIKGKHLRYGLDLIKKL